MRKRKQIKCKQVKILGLLLAVCLLSGCLLQNSKIIFTTGTGKNEVFRVDKEVATTAEMLVYLTTTERQYEEVYGKEILKQTCDGQTVGENIKQTVLEKLAQVKTMYLMAKDRKCVLDATEEGLVKQASQKYLDSLSEEEKTAIGANEEVLEKLYTQYALANKIYDTIIADTNPEISDDEARTLTIEHIVLHTYTRDADGKKVEMTDKAKALIYEKAISVKEQLDSGERTFEELAMLYSDDSTLTYHISKGDLEGELEDILFKLANGEVSDVIQDEQGYHLLKCISTLDREETEKNKLILYEQQKAKAFGLQYDDFVKTLVRRMNKNVWNELTFIDVEEETDTDFFDIYNSVFSTGKNEKLKN